MYSTITVQWDLYGQCRGHIYSEVWREVKEHQKAPSQIYDHSNTTVHTTTIENLSIVGREDQNLIRTIKEVLFISVNNPSLNRNIGKYHLPHLWDEVLFNTSEIKLNQTHR